jgi:hypothetical protein
VAGRRQALWAGCGRPGHGGVAGITPLPRCGRRRARAGGRAPRRSQSVEAALPPGWLATCRRRNRNGSFGGDTGWCVPSGGCVARLVEVDHRCRHPLATSTQLGRLGLGPGTVLAPWSSLLHAGPRGGRTPERHELAVAGQATPSRSAHCPAGLLEGRLVRRRPPWEPFSASPARRSSCITDQTWVPSTRTYGSTSAAALRMVARSTPVARRALQRRGDRPRGGRVLRFPRPHATGQLHLNALRPRGGPLCPRGRSLGHALLGARPAESMGCPGSAG